MQSERRWGLALRSGQALRGQRCWSACLRGCKRGTTSSLPCIRNVPSLLQRRRHVPWCSCKHCCGLGIVQARAVIGVCTAGEKILHIVGALPWNIAVGIDALFAGVAAIELLVTGKLHLIPDGAAGFCLTDDCHAGIDREYAQLLVYLVPGPERVSICWLRRVRVPARPISGSSITKSIKRATIRFFKVITPHFIRQSPQRDIRGTGPDALLQSLWWHIWSMWDGSHRRCRYAWTAGRHKS